MAAWLKRPRRAALPRSAIHVDDRLEHALAGETLGIAVPQLQSLVDSGRSTRRYGGAAARSSVQNDVDLDGRITAGIDDLAAFNFRYAG